MTSQVDIASDGENKRLRYLGVYIIKVALDGKFEKQQYS